MPLPGDKTAVRRAARLSIDFAVQLKAGDRFRDLHQVAHDSLVLLEGSSEQYPDLIAQLAKLDGNALRMLGRSEDSLGRSQQALSIKKARLSNDDLALIYMEMAFAHRVLEDNAASVEAANKVLLHAHKGSGLYMQASELIATIQEDKEVLHKTLTTLLHEAKSKGRIVVSNNLAISLAIRTDDDVEAIRLYNTVLEGKGDDYNKVRAVLGKGETLKSRNRLIDLSNRDKRLLGTAYTYTHAQRLGGLFDRAHDIIWQFFASQTNSLPALVALYRHSSFQWRLRGESQRELIYLRDLERRGPFAMRDRGNERIKLDLEYLRLRQLAFQSDKTHSG